jgi:magnesium-protoporphyrin O-methyltransferase
MESSTYLDRRERLTTYFDQTAAAAWRALTSNAPVSRIRATVRAGRDEMRATLLDWLPDDLSGHTLVDAGCGTGALSIEAARRGANVFAVDVAGSLVDVARERVPADLGPGTIEFHVGDMLADLPERADYVVAMDSLIHYDFDDVVNVVTRFSECAKHKILFTSAPWTPMLGMMHFVGGYLPNRQDRAPAIEPIRIGPLRRELDARLGGDGWWAGRTQRIKRGFYISQAIEVTM